MAVKAPFGSTLEVPDPDEGMPSGRRRYEIQLTSRSGPIDVFLIQDQPLPLTATNSVVTSSVPASEMAAESSLLATHDDMLLKHFHLPSDPYNFELKPGEGIGDLYGFVDMFGGVSPYDAAPISNVKLSKQ